MTAMKVLSFFMKEKYSKYGRGINFNYFDSLYLIKFKKSLVLCGAMRRSTQFPLTLFYMMNLRFEFEVFIVVAHNSMLTYEM